MIWHLSLSSLVLLSIWWLTGTISSHTATAAAAEAGGGAAVVVRHYRVFHALSNTQKDDEEMKYHPRGTIQLALSNTNTDNSNSNSNDPSSSPSIEASIEQEEGNVWKMEGGDGNEKSWQDSWNKALTASASASALYMIKVVDEKSGSEALASVPACDVRRANFREEIGLMIGSTGSLLSISYTVLVYPLAPPCSPFSSSTTSPPKFRTTITYETSQHAMNIPLLLPQTRPPSGLLYSKKQRKISSTTSSSEDNNNDGGGSAIRNPFIKKNGNGNDGDDDYFSKQGFLTKYWYIIVPLMILILFGGNDEDEQQQQQQQGQQQGQQGGGGAAATGGGGGAGGNVATRGTSSGGGGARRSKRG